MSRFLCFLVLALAARAATPAPNILMIAVDDLRPQLACYGATAIKSPHIDRLAAGGVLFERAYCMVPTCGSSRASLMTSIRPSQIALSRTSRTPRRRFRESPP